MGSVDIVEVHSNPYEQHSLHIGRRRGALHLSAVPQTLGQLSRRDGHWKRGVDNTEGFGGILDSQENESWDDFRAWSTHIVSSESKDIYQRSGRLLKG